jgi:8-hydroxy-5-deazaflavin:NADPH oxidoreductase
MNIGILGSGVVAQTLAAGLIKHHHAVTLGTRDAGKLADYVKANPTAKTGSFADAAAFGELLILAVKGSAADDVLRAAKPVDLANKTIIDACNPIEEGPPVNGVLRFTTGPNESLMESLQEAFPQSHFVKAFNSVGAAHMVDPQYAGGKPTMFICGNNPAAKTTVTGLLTQLGWETADMGHVESARAIEPLCMLWCARGFLYNKWDHAFKLLTTGH